MAADFSIRFAPPGPVAAAFMDSPARVKLIMGPEGSGKTSCCLLAHVFKAVRQVPSPIDGVRRYKLAVIRDTYRQLEKTTIPSWNKWFPKTMGQWVGGSGGQPATHTVPIDIAGVGRVEIIVEFIGLGEHKVEDVMRGWEGTSAYINEADLLVRDVLTHAYGRCNRYPSKDAGGATDWMVTLDMNAPDTDNWTYDKFVDQPPEGYAFFRQPSGFSPQAENLQNLNNQKGDDYYAEKAKGQPEWYVRRYIRNEFGYSREGLPVYPEWSDSRHCAIRELEPVKGIPLVLGLDAGLTPAAIINQHLPNGQWRTLYELVVGEGESVGPRRFASMLVQLLGERYDGFTGTAWADPSTEYGADAEGGEQTWLEIVAAELKAIGITVKPAPTQEIIARHEAVRGPLGRSIDGETLGYVLSPQCRILRKGFNSGYRYRRRRGSGGPEYDPKPEKNAFSHPHDALQYALSGGGEHQEMTGHQRREQARRGLPERAIMEPDADDLAAFGGRAPW